MWTKIAHTIIKYRLWLMILLALITAFMGYKAQELELSYDYVQAVPSTDEDMVYYKQFKQQFGEDANLLAIGVNDTAIYQLDNFRRFKYLSDEIGQLPGVKYILSLTNLTVLPSLLMAFDNGKSIAHRKGQDFVPLIEHYDEFYQEDEAEEIDLGKLELPANG